jgi:hypothetical protein
VVVILRVSAELVGQLQRIADDERYLCPWNRTDRNDVARRMLALGLETYATTPRAQAWRRTWRPTRT